MDNECPECGGEPDESSIVCSGCFDEHDPPCPDEHHLPIHGACLRWLSR